MNSIIHKLLIAYAIVSVSAAPAINPHAGLSSLKEILASGLSKVQKTARPIIGTMREYPKLTIAFTVLSCLCISALQDIVQNHREVRLLESKRTRIAQLIQQKHNECERLKKEEKGLDAALILESNRHNDLDSRIRLRKARTNLSARVKQQKQAARLATIPENSVLHNAAIDTALQTTKQSLEQLQANLLIKQQELRHLQQSPETQECTAENKKRASAIRSRKLSDIHTVFSSAQKLAEKDVREKAEILALQKQILSMLEQLKSIRERYELTYEDYRTKYDQRLNNNTRDFYRDLTTTEKALGTNYSGIIATLSELVHDPERLDYDIKRPFKYMFFTTVGRNELIPNSYELVPNPFAKENFDAYLLGERELARIKPSKEQYQQATALQKQLNTKWFALQSALDPRRIEQPKDVAPSVQSETQPVITSLSDLLSWGTYAKK